MKSKSQEENLKTKNKKMKKIVAFLFLACSGISVAFAQGLQVKVNGQDVAEGATVSVVSMAPKAQFELTNTTSADMSVTAFGDFSGLPSGAFASFCWEECYSTDSIPPRTLAAGDTYGDNDGEDFHLEPLGMTEGQTWTAPMTFKDVVSGAEFSFTLVFTVGTAANEGFDLVEVSAYPNPASEIVNFRLGNVKSGSHLVLRDMSGRSLKVLPLDGKAEASMDLEGLASGVYFYSVEENGKAVATRKLVVR